MTIFTRNYWHLYLKLKKLEALSGPCIHTFDWNVHPLMVLRIIKVISFTGHLVSSLLGVPFLVPILGSQYIMIA